MQRKLTWLNLYGREPVQHKLKNGLKTQKVHFLTVFELMSDSLIAILVEPHQCPLHQSILLTQEPIHEMFTREYWELAIVRITVFLNWPFWFFFSKKICFFLHFRENQLKISGYQNGCRFFCKYQNIGKTIDTKILGKNKDH